MNRVLFKSESVEWPTPKALYEKLHEEFKFNFDPCPDREFIDRLALSYANEIDGTSHLYCPWAGKRVFCNPPYTRQSMHKWLSRGPEAELAVFLIPARTDTKWFHDLVLPKASEIRFIKGRLKFGDAKSGAPFPSMLVIFKKAVEQVREGKGDKPSMSHEGFRMGRRLFVTPCDLAEANAFVSQHHRHHGMVPGAKFSVGASDGDKVVGVAICGRPVSRLLDDGLTLEVTRLATDGTQNACSLLYAACWRAARAMGYRKVVTYILGSESGKSLEASGWTKVGECGGGTWSRKSRPRVDKHPTQGKIRWEIEG